MLKYKFFLILVVLLTGCDAGQQAKLKQAEDRLSDSEQKVAAMTASTEQSHKQLEDAEIRLGTLEQKLQSVTSNVNRLSADRNGSDSASSVQPVVDDLKHRVESLESDLDEIRRQLTKTETKSSPTAPPMIARSADPEPTASMPSIDSMPDVDSETDAETLTAKEQRAKKKQDRNKFSTTLLSWNVESEGSDPAVIAKQLADFNRYDIYGLSEVLPQAAPAFQAALGPGYESLVTRTGNNDRLQIIYSTKKYELLRRLELDDINYQNRYRSPLVAHLQDRVTKQQLLVMNNHLARGRAEVRAKQASQLVQWAREQNLPIVAIGDYNFDYEFKSRKGNEGFVNFMRDGIWKWVEPVELIDTNWYDNPKNPDGIPDYPDSMLDFAFVAGSATEWKAVCRVIVRPGDFPDNETTSDHRPFELYVERP